jgi:hypothetical protein
MLNPPTFGPIDRDVDRVLSRRKADRVGKGAPVAGAVVEARDHDGLTVLEDIHIHSEDSRARLIGHFHVAGPDSSELTADHRQSDHRDDGREPFPGRGGSRGGLSVRHLNRGYGD